jgi:hypothetical protein
LLRRGGEHGDIAGLVGREEHGRMANSIEVPSRFRGIEAAMVRS